MSPKVLRAIGHAAMDAQHQLLMDLLQKIVSLLKDGGSDEQFMNACLEFKGTLATHFGAEEAALKEAKYEKLHAHAEHHKEIILKISQSIAAMELVSSTSTKFAIVNEIENTLYQHEIVEDADYTDIALKFPEAHMWTDDLSVGVDWIDDQHKSLFSI